MSKIRYLKYRYTTEGCIEPTSHTNHDGKGYPVYRRGGKLFRMYRHRFEKKFGLVPPGLVIRHTCDNRKCINTDHMLLGTRADNMRDRTERGRTPKGEKNGRALLLEDEVKFILTSTQKNCDIARQFNVSADLISLIRHGKRWKHLQPQAQ